MSRKILGLDVRKDEVTAILLISSINGNQITAVEHVVNKDEVPKTTEDKKDSDTDDKDDSQASSTQKEDFLSRALEYISTKIDFSGCICIASIPPDEVSFRNISVPFKSTKDIMRVLPYELEPTLPFPINNINIDFQKIEDDQEDELLTAIIDSNYLQSFLETLATYQLNPYVVSVGGYATAINAIHYDSRHRLNGFFLDIDRKKCSLALFVSGRICYYRNFPIDIESGSLSNDLMDHIHQTMITFHENRETPFIPEVIFLTGSGLNGLNVGNELHQELGIPVQKTNLLEFSRIETVIPGNWQPEIMDNPLALSLVEVFDIDTLNFCDRPIAGKKIFTEYKNRFVRSGILALTVIIFALIGFFSDLYITNKKIDQLDKKIDGIFKKVYPTLKIPPELRVQQMKNKVDEYKKAAGTSSEDKEKVLTIDILNRISKGISKNIDIEVSKLVIGKENIQMSGETNSYDAVDEMKNSLERVKLFKSVKINSATIDKSSKKIRFKMKILLQ